MSQQSLRFINCYEERDMRIFVISVLVLWTWGLVPPEGWDLDMPILLRVLCLLGLCVGAGMAIKQDLNELQ